MDAKIRSALGTALDPLVEAIAERVAEIVIERIEARMGSPLNTTSPLLNKQQLALTLGVSTASIDRYIAAGRIAATLRIGPDGPQRFDLAQVRAALKNATVTKDLPRAIVDEAPRLLKRRAR